MKAGLLYPASLALGWERTPDRTPVVVSERVTLVTLNQKVIGHKVDLHIGFVLYTLHVRQTVDVGQQEPSS